MSDCDLQPRKQGGYRCSLCQRRSKVRCRRVCAAATAGEEYAEAGPCVHRGPVAQRTPCKACGMRDEIAEVYACDLHGRCTLRFRGLPGVRNCVACFDVETEA